MSLTIWHNPRCSKSRQALQILTDSGTPFTTRLYLEDPPDAQTIRDTLHKLAPKDSNQNINPRTLIRTKDALYKNLHLDAPTLTNEDLIEAMAQNPSLIERPIVITLDRAIIGRPPEDILQLL